MASRRYRAKNSLNSNISQVNARISQIGKRPAPRKIAENSVTSVQIRTATITAANLDKGSVTNEKIAPDAIRTGNIEDGAVTTPKIVDASITAEKLAQNSVNLSSTTVITSTLPVNKGGTGAVTFSAGFVKASGNTAFTTSTIAASDVPNLDAGKITSGTFDDARIPSLTADKIPNLDAGKITSGTFADARIPSLDADKITSGTFGTGRIPTITGSMIGSQTITSGNIAANAVGASELDESENYTVNNLTTTLSLRAGTSVTSENGQIQALGPPTTGSAANTRYIAAAANFYVLHLVSSAAKYKLDQQSLNTGLNILNLQPKTWVDKSEYENNSNSYENLRRIPGFIAEDLLEAGLEEFVEYNFEGEVQSISYDRLVAAVIPVLKHQQEKIQSLEDRLKALEDRLS